jgi:hypothetical protein
MDVTGARRPENQENNDDQAQNAAETGPAVAYASVVADAAAEHQRTMMTIVLVTYRPSRF